MSRRVSFEVLTLMGVFLIVRMAFGLWHHPDVGYDYLGFGINTLFIVASWILCRKIFQELDQLGERVGDGALSRLSKHAVALSYLGYVVIYELTFMHRR